MGMLEKIKQTPRKFIVFGLMSLISITLMVIYFSKYPQQSVVLEPSPTPESLTVTTVIPTDGVLYARGQRDPLFVYTNFEVNPLSVIVTASPDLTFTVKVRSDDPKRIIIQPTKPWTADQYTVTIRKGVVSQDRQHKLDTDIKINLTILEVPLEFSGGEPH